MIGGTKQKTDKTRCSVSQKFPSGVGWNHKQRNRGDKISYITSNRGGSELTLKLYYRPVTVANKTTAYHPITSQKQWPHQPVSTSVFSFSTVSLRFSRFLPFSAPEEPQWWEISPSCQHFNGIKECVNQSTSSSKMEPPPLLHACYFSPSWALRWGINSQRWAGSPEPNCPAHRIFAVSNKQHESTVSCNNMFSIPLNALPSSYKHLHGNCRTVLILSWFCPDFL